MKKYIQVVFLSCILIPLFLGCKSTKILSEKSPFLSSKVSLIIPYQGELIKVKGTFKMISSEKMQISILAPIFRSELFRIEVSPNKLLAVDRMNKRYISTSRKELQDYLPRKYIRKLEFSRLEKFFRKKSLKKKVVISASELGIKDLKEVKISFYDFSNKSFQIRDLKYSRRYRSITFNELIKALK